MIDTVPLLQAPFIVAVTGHVDPDEPEELSRIIQQQLRAIQKEAELQEPKPQQFLLLSALAKGADSIAARAAIELYWQVIAPLPLPLDEYRRDFKDDELTEFDQLIKRIPNFFIGYAPGCDEHNTREQNSEGRNRQYAFLGEFLTRHCEVLIACWDGDVAAGMGGTGDVVELQLRGIPEHLLELRAQGALLDPPEGGRVIQILTARSKAPEKKAQPFEGDGFKARRRAGTNNVYDIERVDARQTKSGKSEEEERFQQRRAHWQRFVEAAGNVNWEEPKDKDDVLPHELAKQSNYLVMVREAYYRADARAGHLKAEVKRTHRLLLGFSLGVTMSVSVAGAWNQGIVGDLLLVLTWAFLLGAWLFVQQQKKSEHDKEFQDCRALAEAFRVLYFWRAAGIEEPLDTFYLRYQRSELDWIRGALRVADLQWRAQFGWPTGDKSALEWARTHWIEEQHAYFSSKFPKDREELTWLRYLSLALLWVGLSASALGAVASLRVTNDLNNGWVLELWRFATSFASADLLSSPFLPAVLLLARMNKWPRATEANTRDTDDRQSAVQRKLRELRVWFINQKMRWVLAGVALGLFTFGAGALLIVGLLPAAPLVPILALVATLCFFAPLLIWLHAEFEGLPENVERYERMFRVFDRARELFDRVVQTGKPEPQSVREETEAERTQRENRTKRAQLVLSELGREALQENGEWLIVHRNHDLNMEV